MRFGTAIEPDTVNAMSFPRVDEPPLSGSPANVAVAENDQVPADRVPADQAQAEQVQSDQVQVGFVDEIVRCLSEGSVAKIVLAKYTGREPGLQRITIKPLMLREMPSLSFVTSFTTKDVTKNFSQVDGIEEIRNRISDSFSRAHLLTRDEDIELGRSKRGTWTLRRTKVNRVIDVDQTHDRAKSRYLTSDLSFLVDLGITDRQHQVIPTMARKWKQINKFAEVLDTAIGNSALQGASQISAVDFGSGKGYLTFALHHLITVTRATRAQVTGVELRQELVDQTNAAARRANLDGLQFVCGDVETHGLDAVDIMVALHACDTATDHAIHAGIRAGASLIVCSPCCHKELRPQLQSPSVMEPLLRHGIHQSAIAEMVTDTLRALLLELHGYETKVFEFISPEQTSKNKMILATRRVVPIAAQARRTVFEKINQLKAFYGIETQTLEQLLAHAR